MASDENTSPYSRGKVSLSRFRQRSRTSTKANNRLGLVEIDGVAKPQFYRKDALNVVDKYYTSTQYDHLQSWESWEQSDQETSSRTAKPKLIYPMLKIACDRLSSKLLGADTFPEISIADDPDLEYFAGIVERQTMLKAKIQSALKKLPVMGSAFVRTMIVEGKPEIEKYETKFCYPEFDAAGELLSVEIRYLFEDPDDLDKDGNPVKKWFKLELGQMQDKTFDNPIYQEGQAPEFVVVGVTDHQLGFVQGAWFRTSFEKHSPDGETFVNDAFYAFMDEFNYNLSKTAGAAEYGTDPQLYLSNMLDDEVDELIKKTGNAWNLGREGEAGFIEASQSGVAASNEFRDKHLDKKMMDIARIAILDPEKIVGSAQSAKAMEVLHGPMLDFINELRPYAEAGITEVYKKILATLIIMNQRGFKLAFTMPPQYKPVSFDIAFSWPPVFPMTIQDRQQVITGVTQLTINNLMSRETGLKWLMALMPEIPVEDIEEEVRKVNTQQQFNTFGF